MKPQQERGHLLEITGQEWVKVGISWKSQEKNGLRLGFPGNLKGRIFLRDVQEPIPVKTHRNRA